MSFNRRDQRLRINPQQTLLLLGPKLGAVTRPGVEVWRDGEQSGGRFAGLQLDPLAPGFQHLGHPGNLVLAQLVAA